VATALRSGSALLRDPDRDANREREPRSKPPGSPQPSQLQRFAAQLAKYRDLRRHFIVEYYDWYQSDPWRHWDEAGRTPPTDIAAFAVPALGPYDSRDAKAIEQHARWLADAGVGAINVSWWGPGSTEDRAVPLIMDVMRAHDIHVTFHIEPYTDDRWNRVAEDILYLVRTYGDRRRYDAFLLLEDARGVARPVFKFFRALVTPTVTDCHGKVFPVPDYTEDASWHRQIDTLRNALGADLQPILLSDSLSVERNIAAGFDGVGQYDPFVGPQFWPDLAKLFSDRQLLFSFNINAGFDPVPARPPFGDCYTPARFEPPITSTGWDLEARTEALNASHDRIVQSLLTTVGLQLDATLSMADRGVFVTYINSFNEWHEGTAFEAALNLADLSPGQRAIGYHNPDAGRWRLDLLHDLLAQLETPPA
jgi:glycosyl hydrolase family 99